MGIEKKTAHLRVKPRRILPEGDGGTIFWATPSRARDLLDQNAVVLLNAPAFQPAAGPTETKPAGASETKEVIEKKSSATAQAGPSTDSASSSEPGMVAQSSASEAAPASPKRRSRKSAPPAAE